jgi:hypothetical protein
MEQADARWQAEELAGDTFRDRTRGEHFSGAHRAVFRDGWAAGVAWAREEMRRQRELAQVTPTS